MVRTLDQRRRDLLRNDSAVSSVDSLVVVPWKTTLLTGFGFGAAAGLIESLIAVMREGRSIGTFPLLTLAIWAAVGGVAAVTGRMGATAAEPLASRATIALRTSMGLVLFAAPVWASILGGEGPHWRKVVTTGMVALLALSVWLTSPALSRRRALQRPLAALTRVAPTLIVLALAVCALLVTGRGEPGRLVRLPASPSTNRTIPTGSLTTRLFLIGLDSASWAIVQPLLDRGELPHLRGLLERGWRGVLRSTEPSFSPVVWTSVMTGKQPTVHGVQRTATERRVKTLWDIASEAGLRATVVNVPGTYPARADDAVSLFSGFPLPSQASLTSLGWIITAGPAPSYPIAPVYVPLPAPLTGVGRGERVEAEVELVDLPPESRLLDSVPMAWLRKLGLDNFAYALTRRVAGRRYGRLALTVERGEGGIRVTGRGNEPLFELSPGEWSDWLLLERDECPAWFRVHYTAAGSQPTLLVTPLFRLPEESFSGPAAQRRALLARPHVPEGAGWTLAFDQRLIASLREHLLETADSLTETALAALDDSDPDLFAYVITVTDRMQHGFMKFAFPEPYWRLARERGGDYERYQPTPRQVADYGDAVTEAYRRSDVALGRILERAAPGSWVLVVSDHGAHAGPRERRQTAGAHSSEGLYVIARTSGHLEDDADLTVGEQGPELKLEDITPIALHLLDLPVARDMAGRVPSFLVAATDPVTEVPTYEGNSSAPRSTTKNEEKMREQLRALGYLE